MALPKLKIQKVKFGAIAHMVAIDNKWIGTVQELKIDVNDQSKVTITFVVDDIETLPTFEGSGEQWAIANGLIENKGGTKESNLGVTRL